MSNEERVDIMKCPECEKNIFKILGRSNKFYFYECSCGKKVAIRYYRGVRQNFKCPKCEKYPPIGNYWECNDPETKEGCHNDLDTFRHGAECPRCGISYSLTQCTFCHGLSRFEEWRC